MKSITADADLMQMYLVETNLWISIKIKQNEMISALLEEFTNCFLKRWHFMTQYQTKLHKDGEID